MTSGRAAIVILSTIALTALSWTAYAQDAGTSITTAYAPAQVDAPSNGVIDSVIKAVGRDDEVDNGNPLWSVPLSSLAETRERPLFSSSRRPPPIVPLAATPPPPAQDPGPIARAQPERPPWVLIGTIVGRAASLAIVQNSGTQAVSRIRVGDEDSGWRVRSVAARSIVVEKGGETVTLELPRVSGTEAQTSP